MNLFMLFERTTCDKYEWGLCGIFDSEKEARAAQEIYIEQCPYKEDFDDGDCYFEIKTVKCNQLFFANGFGLLFGYNGLPFDKVL